MKPLLLIAEGNPELCEVYRKFLAERSFLVERGYDVGTATNGLKCVEKLRRLKPMVLVLDRELRWGGGDGVLAWLREQSDTTDVSVVLTTSVLNTSTDIFRDFQPPVVKFLRKPFTMAALLDGVCIAIAERDAAVLNLNRAAVYPDLLAR